MTVSILGKMVTFQVVDIKVEEDSSSTETNTNNTDTDNLLRLQHLSLEEGDGNKDNDDDEGDDNDNGCGPQDHPELWKAIENCPVRLCPITPRTKFEVLWKSPNDNGTTNSSDQNPQQQQQLDSKQYVVGLDREIQAALDAIQATLVRSELFASRSVRPPRGVLLHGPSGVGKSAMAKQIAHQLQESCDVQFVSCMELQMSLSIVGEAERQLSRYFRRRRRRRQPYNKPTLLVLDDIQLICPRRGAPNTPPGVDQLASTLLSLMDGLESTTGTSVTSSEAGDQKSNNNNNTLCAPLMILAITPNPSLLDPALRRPGRLDTEIEVPLPDEPATRGEILKFHFQNMNLVGNTKCITDDEWLQLGKLAKGFNGSDCMLAIKEATRAAQIRNLQSGAETDNASPTLEDLMSGIRHTKPSSIKAVTVEIPQVKWSDIGGMEDVKQQLREAIEQPLLQAELYTQLGLPSPKGILLYGPPGCSKTLTARALATEGQMNFLAVKGPELLSKWLGESERALASLFRRARMASPAIIFFDEMDAIASKRGSGASASSSRMLSQLLTELDGVTSGGGTTKGRGKPHPRVIVVGATNRPDLLDPALARPGRMDRMIYVGPPDMESRKKIFEIGLKERPCAESVDITALAEASDGFSGAEIIAICRDASLLALEEQLDTTVSTIAITPQHMEQAMKNMKRQISPEMLAFYDSYRHRHVQ